MHTQLLPSSHTVGTEKPRNMSSQVYVMKPTAKASRQGQKFSVWRLSSHLVSSYHRQHPSALAPQHRNLMTNLLNRMIQKSLMREMWKFWCRINPLILWTESILNYYHGLKSTVVYVGKFGVNLEFVFPYLWWPNKSTGFKLHQLQHLLCKQV